MATATTCAVCGAELTSDVPQGLCPRCLLGRGLETPRSPDSSALEETAIDTDSPKRPPAPLPRTGQQFGGYSIGRLLGQGGMGAVFEAEHIESGRRVALKVLNHALDSDDARKRFLREGSLAASVSHPNTVYVYGTEEIEGTPVISMELVAKGTLKDRVKESGPLPVAEAVDVVLQIIAGLEAAEAASVLHRDIKPSNCFVSPDGTVKVGDFGLSISTLARGQSMLTATGAVLGTPSFASPEQLRGEELDVRSDVYSVGATLYYLLTGKPPFEAKDLVNVISAVLERTPEEPKKLRREIPRGLAKIVMRCLAKGRAARFQNYEKLKEALHGFSSVAPTPATLGLRFIAGVIGYLAFSVMLSTAGVGESFGEQIGRQTKSQAHQMSVLLGISLQAMAWTALLVVPCVVTLFYCAILEGVFGTSLGKFLCGLRVIDRNGRVPGIMRSALRASVFWLPLFLGIWAVMVSTEDMGDREKVLRRGVAAVVVGYFFQMLLFVTIRRRNGFAGLHELVSGTRVVLSRSRSVPQRRSLPPDDLTIIRASAAQHGIGPYVLFNPVEQRGPVTLVDGFDEKLRRKTWITLLPSGTSPISTERCELSRITRLRWLDGRRSGSECWDAYEALEGKPLLNLLAKPQPWASVRIWLHDLAAEIRASREEDPSLLPTLELDRVWITSQGRAMLLDFPAPGIEPLSRSPSPEPLAGSENAVFSERRDEDRVFLNQVAICALEGRIVDRAEAGSRSVTAPLPVRVYEFLRDLPTGADFEAVTTKLKSFTESRAAVGWKMRLCMLLGCALLMLSGPVETWRGYLPQFRQDARDYPEILPLSICSGRLAVLERYPQADWLEEKRALRVWISGRYHYAISDKRFWQRPLAAAYLSAEDQERCLRALNQYPKPSEDDLNNARTLLKTAFPSAIHADNVKGWAVLKGGFPSVVQVPPEVQDELTRFASEAALTAFFVQDIEIALWIIASSLVAALLFRGGLLVHGLGSAFVTKTGAKASRWRVFVRGILAWSPFLAFCALVKILYRLEGTYAAFVVGGGISSLIFLVATLAMLILICAAVIFSLKTPARSLQDRIAGTWLVPR